MKILVLGGTRFIGTHVVRFLTSWGHEVTLFNRGLNGSEDAQVRPTIIGDRRDLLASKDQLREIAPDVIVDMIALSVTDAEQLVTVFDKPSQRLVVISSLDVYRAYGRYCMSEPGEPDLIPLMEDDPLRTTLLPMSSTYDKPGIERLLKTRAPERSTVLRLPVVFGENDYQHRFRDYLNQMDSGVKEISLEPALAEWRCATGYVADVGLAIALAAKNSKAAGKTYNVADSFAFTQTDYVRAIGRAAGWNGKVVTAAAADHPVDCDYNQHLIVDTSAIRTDLGYSEQVPINEAFERTVAWERAVRE